MFQDLGTHDLNLIICNLYACKPLPHVIYSFIFGRKYMSKIKANQTVNMLNSSATDKSEY
ncbi:Unknown protein sequence [Pseudomonas coronafaciens pv. oryzae]|nr:Unknown protein sequence [Pseudomonas coronafaciens pv. oryzae]